MTRSILRSLALAAGTLIVVGGCAGADSPVASADLDTQYVKLARPAADGARFSVSGTETVAVVIGPEGGTIENGGHKLVFPAGALAEPTEIRMTLDPRYVGVQMQPHGLVFPAGHEPELTIRYAGVDASGFTSVSIGYVGTTGTLLEVLPSSDDPSQGLVRSSLRHFSGYIGVGSGEVPTDG